MKQLSQSSLGSPTLPDSPCHYRSQLISTQCEFPSTDDLLHVRSLKLGGLQVKQIGSGNVTYPRPYVAKPRFLTWCQLTLSLSTTTRAASGLSETLGGKAYFAMRTVVIGIKNRFLQTTSMT